MCLLHSRLSLRCSMAFGVRQGVDKRDLKLDLLTSQRGRGRHGLDLRKRLRQLFGSLNQCRACQRPLPRLTPPLDGRFRKTRPSEVVRQQSRFGLRRGGKAVAQSLGGATVQELTPALEQVLVSSVLNE